MGTLLATRLKNRRKELKMSQRELAEGICKQGQISRLENGEFTPGADFLYALSKKLKVSIDYFYNEQIGEEIDELLEFKKLAQTFITNRNYESLKYIYELESVKVHRLSLVDKFYMEWIKSLIDFYFYGQKEEAVARLEKVLSQLNVTDLIYLQVANTLFNFYYDIEVLESFNKIREKLECQVNQLKLNTIEELNLSIKFNYNVCRYLWLQNNTEEAITKITDTIKQCKMYRTTYLLADLYVLMGNVSKNFSSKVAVKDYFETAYFLYKLEGNMSMALKIEHYIADLTE
ncbi:helix-turn-helix domain-containing protein [Streptococcus sp. CL5.50]|uniref:Transcriptional repressor DicA n=3 Tax=Streptococcus mitis group TaxID=3409772 RepID=A0A428EJ74_STRMT|nr:MULTISPECIES: helix-turn-helix transcriptional regulator [Streptococcus]RSJ11995.1 transcriptional repressor DicA [Streptococcus mitis]BDB09449.1 transcriptional regulator [Streptococcus toyakuensis]